MVLIRYYIFMTSLNIQSLLERLSSLLRSESRNVLVQHGLQPVQFEALHYLSICNHYSNTPMAVTEYLVQTKGTVSQTLKVLEKKGLIKKVPDKKDKRVTHLLLTPEGSRLVDALLPAGMLKQTCGQFSDAELSTINLALIDLLKKHQQVNHFKSFGQCASCIHHLKLEKQQFFCNLTQEPLSKDDIEKICREHQPNVGAD